MANIKITDYEDASSTFTLPYNPATFDATINKFVDQRTIPYSFTYLSFTSPIKSPINITLNGKFIDSTKNTDYSSVMALVNNHIMLKLYYQNDYSKFYLCTGVTLQKIHAGVRPTQVDYVGSFFSPFGLLFDETQQNGNNTSSNSNDGNVATPIEKITGTVTAAGLVTIKDGNGNGFKFTPSQSGTMTYYLVKMNTDDNMVHIAEYMYVQVDDGGGTIEKQVLLNADTSGDILLTIAAGDELNDTFTGGTVSGITSPLFYFRNGWSSD